MSKRKQPPSNLSDLAALQILREPEIDPKRKANQADWDKIAEMLGGKRATLPEGAFTLRQYCKQFGINRGGARGDLDVLEKQGKLDTAMHYDEASGRAARWWWLKKDSPRAIKKQSADKV